MKSLREAWISLSTSSSIQCPLHIFRKARRLKQIQLRITDIVHLRDCVSYGVEVPGCEGKAGMVAIQDPDRAVDLKALAQGLSNNLPSYARPLFLRLVDKVELTGTFKLKKFNLQAEGFNPDIVKDALYFLRPGSNSFTTLDKVLFDDIVSGSIRL